MNKGFYIIQFVNNDIKIECLSYIDTTTQLTDVSKVVYIGESIADLISSTPIRTVVNITNKIMHTSNFLSFNKDELNHIRKLISNLIADYLK